MAGIMNFAALDFETANSDQSSVCAMAIAFVRDGRIVDSFSTLVKPKSDTFDERCVRVHGIRATDVQNAPAFEEAWERVEEKITTLPVIAHNAPFDLSILNHHLRLLSRTTTFEKWACTCEIARALLPGLPNHRLPTLARVFGISLNHHDPASDAQACAELGIPFDRMAAPDGLVSFIRPIRHFTERVTNTLHRHRQIRRGDARYLEISIRDVLPTSLDDGRRRSRRRCCAGWSLQWHEVRFYRRPCFPVANRRRGIRHATRRTRHWLRLATDRLSSSPVTMSLKSTNDAAAVRINWIRQRSCSAAGKKVKILTEDEFIDLIE